MSNRTSYRLVAALKQHMVVANVLVGLLYVSSTLAALEHARVHYDLCLIWPGAGVALAAILTCGVRVWPSVAVAGFLILTFRGAPPSLALWITITSTVEVLAIAKVLTRVCGFNGTLQRTRDVLALVAFAVGLGPLLGASFGVAGYAVHGLAPMGDYLRMWRIWWLDEMMGMLLVATSLMVWLHPSGETLTRRRLLEAAGLLVLLAFASHIVYGGILEDRLSRPLSFVCFPFVIWGALRFGQRGAVTTSVVAVGIAIVNMVLGAGPFLQSSPTMSLVYLFGFAAAMMVAGLLLGAVVTEFRAATIGLQQAGELLEARVNDRTAALQEQLIERERVSTALRDSEERYRRITQTITDYIYTVKFLDGHPVETIHAPTCEVVTGYSTAELKANPFLWLSMVHPDDRKSVLQLTPQILATHKSVTIEHRIVRKDGVVRWVQNTTAPKVDADGRVVSYDGLVKDITDRKEAEEALRESEAKFRAVFTSAGIGIIITSMDAVIAEANPAVERMMGYAAGELTGVPLKRLSHPADLALHRDNTRRILTGGETPWVGYDGRYVRKDGSTLWGHLTSALLRDAQGHPLYAVGLIEDITDRKHEEQEREKLLRTVQAAMANVRTLSGLVPICSNCKKIRNAKGEWAAVEEYLTQHTGAQFSHGICPDCMKRFYPEYADAFAATTAASAAHGSTAPAGQDGGNIEG
jgi:PAS domain S-box-containing protein